MSTFDEIDGVVDSLWPRGATGWAWNSHAPNEYAKIVAVLDGVVIARTVADKQRPDLLRSGKGDGCCGFVLAFAKSISIEQHLQICVDGPSGFVGLPLSSTDVTGFVEHLSRFDAGGWTWAPSEPETALKVEAWIEGKVVGEAIADMLRPDILATGRGTGRYGFSLRFYEPLKGDLVPTFYAIGAGKSTILQALNRLALAVSEQRLDSNSDVNFAVDSSSVASELEELANFGLAVQGAVDFVDRKSARGWAWNPADPQRASNIEAVLDGRIIGRATANLPRQDLADHGKGTGLYGFELTFEELITSDQQLIIRVIGPEGATPLAGTERVRLSVLTNSDTAEELITSQHHSFSVLPQVQGHVDALSRYNVSGWAWIPGIPDLSLQIEAILDGRIVGRGIADQTRPDLASAGLGSGRYGFKVTFDELLVGNSVPTLRALTPLDEILPNSLRLPPLTGADKQVRQRASLRSFMEEHAKFTSTGPDFEDSTSTIVNYVNKYSTESFPLIFAFYLPQFHAVAENDHFWGRGFTEWRQITRGLPRFPGHYQPRVPRDLGFYNLRNQEAVQAQIDLAKKGGVNAFAYYYYWFNRTRVLEKPLNAFLESKIDFPFLIIWANENWTRTWDGSESQILMKQDYKLEDDEALVDDLARHMLDPRYVRIDGRPLFIIYNPKNVPESAMTIARWRLDLRTRYSVNPLIFAAQTFGVRDPQPFGLDGAMEFPPHKLSDKLPGRPTPDAHSPEFTGRVIAYDDFVAASLNEEIQEYPLIKTVVPSWDNDSRRPNRGLTLENSSPQKYEKWLEEIIVRAIKYPIHGRPVVAINAWNEWAEGAYLEPDVYYGSAYLNATARALHSALDHAEKKRQFNGINDKKRKSVSVILPCYNHGRFLPDRIQSILAQTVKPDEIIFLDDHSTDDSVIIARQLLEKSDIPSRIFVNPENSGCVFRQWVKGLDLAKNDLIWIAETDDSAHSEFLEQVISGFVDESVLASYGRIVHMDEKGKELPDLDYYYDGMKMFSWNYSQRISAYRAFSWDFSIRNVIPNASGLVFRKPQLSEEERKRLCEYRFSGDWYFYALALRGGSLHYARNAKSYFRVSLESTSRKALFTKRHLEEHQMVIADLVALYDIGVDVIDAHAAVLASHFDDRTPSDVRLALQSNINRPTYVPLRICIAAHSFATGGGEVLPVELANELQRRGMHVTYLVMEDFENQEFKSIRSRLSTSIAVIFWRDVAESFQNFIAEYGIQVINSHNVSVEYNLFLKHVTIDVPYVASLHGGYETVTDILKPDFIAYLQRNVTNWLPLAEKNKLVLTEHGLVDIGFTQSFNAVPEIRDEWVDRKAFRNMYGIAEEARVIVLCSRAIEEKGWRTAIEVIKCLNNGSYNQWHLVLIGDGPLAKELKKLEIHNRNVTFLGHVDRPMRLFRCFDLGVFPSTFPGETFPLFLLECFKAGLPVVTTGIGEIANIMGSLSDTRPGILVDHGENHSTLVRLIVMACQEIARDDEKLEKMREKAIFTSDRFSFRRLGDLYENVLYSAISVSRSSGGNNEIEVAPELIDRP